MPVLRSNLKSLFCCVMAVPALPGFADHLAERVLTKLRELPKVAKNGVSAKVIEQIGFAGWRQIWDFRVRTWFLTIPAGAAVGTVWWENLTGVPVVILASDVVPS